MSIIYRVLIICCLAVSCNMSSSPEKPADTKDNNFALSRINAMRLISTNVPIGDDIVNMIFDTGGMGLILDSIACTEIFNMKSLDRSCKNTETSIRFLGLREYLDMKVYFYPLDIPFNGGTLHYEWFMSCPGFEERFGHKGVFSIPQNDKNIWDFNFEEHSITISSSLDAEQNENEHPIPDYDFKCCVERKGDKICLKDFPICFAGHGDTLSCKMPLLIDTGNSSDAIYICCQDEYMYREAQNFIDKNAILSYDTKFGNIDLIYASGAINDTLFVRCLPFDLLTGTETAIAGLDLLVRFNITLDLKSGLAYFKKNNIGNICEYIQETSPDERKVFQINPDKDMKTALVTFVGKDSPAYKGGVRQYDVIEKFDGKDFNAFNMKYITMRQKGKGENFTFDIDRFGKRMQIGFFWEITDINRTF